jgi:hypothetical protein
MATVGLGHDAEPTVLPSAPVTVVDPLLLLELHAAKIAADAETQTVRPSTKTLRIGIFMVATCGGDSM